MDVTELLANLGVSNADVQGGTLSVTSPIDGTALATVSRHSVDQVFAAIARAEQAFLQWRDVPAPRRGELVRSFGNILRRHKEQLSALISIETGKILQEGRGEVQEMIDICDYAVGLSRQLYGRTIASERPAHRMQEMWHPLGVVAVISAFNFPAAVWAWNSALAIVCGNSVVWKPSEKAPLTALACASLFRRACASNEFAPNGLTELVLGGRDIGEILAADRRVPLVSATGSTRMGRELAPRVAQRLGRFILELGGNNAGIIAPSADQSLVLRAILFAAVGTAGQRCTSLRRLIVHRSSHDSLVMQLKRAYESLRVGNPLKEGILVGPLIDAAAYQAMQVALAVAREQGGAVFGGERLRIEDCENGYYVKPALVQMPAQTTIMRQETFAPILYIVQYDSLDEAIAVQNDVPQGLSSSIFTMDLGEAERFMSATGSDCGIANVNIGPSGAEIGGAFGGEKETGGGRESGSDSWKGYMRRATNTINYSSDLPLAQGIRFDL